MATSDPIGSTTIVAPVSVDFVDADGIRDPGFAAELRYDVEDPYAVSLSLLLERETVRWFFARDLLVTGSCEPAGDGDVHVWPCLSVDGAATTVVELHGDGEPDVLVEVPTTVVLRFLALTEALVPTGSEARHLDLDLFLLDCLETGH